MDSVRRDVRRGLDKLQVAAVDHGWDRYADPKTLANVREAVEAAIMSALKRGAGVVVSPLVWREHSGLAWVAATPFGQYAIGKLVAGGFTAQFSGSHSVGDFDTLEAAKAACQADFAKRITSAVEPSCVVGGLRPMDEAPKQTEGVLIFREDGAVASCWRGPGIAWRYSGEAYDCFVSDRDGRRAVGWLPLTAALSSRAEEEVRADERERLAKLSDDEADALIADAKKREGQGRSKAGCDAMRARARLLRFFSDWLRSLTNGGE